MSEFVTVELKNFDRMKEVADRYPQIAEKYVGYGITRALTRVMGGAKVEAPQGVTTFLKNRWTIRSSRFEGALVSGTEYAKAVHQGTKPHFVSPGQLMKWSMKRGLNAYAVSKSIGKKGTMPNPFLQRAVDQNKDKMDQDMNNAIKEILSNV